VTLTLFTGIIYIYLFPWKTCVLAGPWCLY